MENQETEAVDPTGDVLEKAETIEDLNEDVQEKEHPMSEEPIVITSAETGIAITIEDSAELIPTTPRNRRKSTRARKGPQPVDADAPAPKARKSIAKAADKPPTAEKRKYTKKRKSEALTLGTGESFSGNNVESVIPQSIEGDYQANPEQGKEPPVEQPTIRKPKKVRRVVQPSPQIVDMNGPVDLPPITSGEGELFIPTKEERKQKKQKHADVPPIECLVFWSKKYSKKIRTPVKPDIVVSEEADIPPSPVEGSEVIIPVTEEPMSIDLTEPNPSTPDSPRKSKKQMQEEAFKKSQPSVLRFFAAKPDTPKQVSETRSEEDSRSNASRRSHHRAPDRPDLHSYLQLWKESKKTQKNSIKKRIFVVKNKFEPVRVLGVHELPRSTKYGGGEPLLRPRPVYIAIHDRERPPVKLIMTHRSLAVFSRRPLAEESLIDYEKDSDEEYEEEKEGEDLNSNGDAEEEGENEEGSEADSFFVSDGHFSDADELSDDEAVVARRRRQEMNVDSEGKATLQLVTFGPAELENLDTADCSENENSANVKWFKLLRDEAGITVFYPNGFFRLDAGEEEKKFSSKIEKPQIDWIAIRPELAKFVHGKASNVDSLCSEFKALRPELSANGIKTEIRAMAAWTKRVEVNSRVAWYVKPELLDSLGLTEEEMTALAMDRRILKEHVAAGNKENVIVQPLGNSGKQTLLFKPTENPVEEREPVRN
jgi:hypothetical protein